MSNRYSDEYVKCIIENSGYTLLGLRRDKNYKLRVTVQCDEKHEAYEVDFYSFKKGGRCKKCSMKNAIKKQRLKYDDVKKYIESYGYSLISEDYINNQKYLEILCPENHLFKMGYGDFQRGRRCRKCSDIKNSKKRRKNFSEIKECFREENYTLISDEKDYKNAQSKLDVICANDHKIKMSWNSFQRGTRCRECSKIRIGESLRKDFNDVVNILKENGYEYLEGEYVNNLSKLKLRCSNGHEFFSTYGKIQSTGRGCAKCSRALNDSKKRLSNENVNEYINSLNYKWISGFYKNNESKLNIVCDKGHEFTSRLGNLKSGNRCPSCRISKGESKVRDVLEKYNIEFKQHYKFDDCIFYKKLTFDFYLPSHNIIIEYDGVFHYQIIKGKGGVDSFIDGKIRDTVKNVYCENNNIKLIRIPYWEFDNIENILMNEINNIN